MPTHHSTALSSPAVSTWASDAATWSVGPPQRRESGGIPCTMIDGSMENNIKLNVDAFCKGKWISCRDLCPLLCDNDYPLVLTILLQFLHPKAKKQSPTRGLQHLTFSSALSQQQLLCWCCSSPLLFEAPFPTVTGQNWSMTCMT